MIEVLVPERGWRFESSRPHHRLWCEIKGLVATVLMVAHLGTSQFLNFVTTPVTTRGRHYFYLEHFMNESLDKLHSFQEQPEALRLADEFENGEWIAATGQWREEAATELRRLHAVNRELLEAQQEPVAKVCHDLDGHIGWNPNLRQLPDEGAALYTSPPTLSLAQRPHECSRSHPHENMNAMCELRTEIARLTNENARLKAMHQDDEINTYRMTLLCIRDGLQQGMSKSIQKLQAREINDVLGLPSFASYRTSQPASKPWVGLTDEEIEQGLKESWVTEQAWQSAVWWAEAKLKDKNQ